RRVSVAPAKGATAGCVVKRSRAVEDEVLVSSEPLLTSATTPIPMPIAPATSNASATRLIGVVVASRGRVLGRLVQAKRLGDVVGDVVRLVARREAAFAHIGSEARDGIDRVGVEVRVATHELRAQVVLE